MTRTIENQAAFKRFDETLERLTGNKSDDYADLCPAMDIITNGHMCDPEGAASIYTGLFGLRRVDCDDDVFDINQKAAVNRYIATLYSYTLSSGRPWVIDGQGGVISPVSTDSESVNRLTITDHADEGIPRFVLSRGVLSESDRRALFDTPRPLGRLAALQDPTLATPIAYAEIGQGCDIGMLAHLLEPRLEVAAKIDRAPARGGPGSSP